jgi:hypothetical protein
MRALAAGRAPPPPATMRTAATRALRASAAHVAGCSRAARRALLGAVGPPQRASAAALATAHPARASSSTSTSASATFLAATEAATARLAELTGGYSPVSLRAGVPPPSPGDAYALAGGVGAGKSAWARGFIRAAVGDPDLPVPSPTYLLHNVYEEVDGPPVHHFDLYRLAGAGGDRVSGGDVSGSGGNGGGDSDTATTTSTSPGLDAFDIDRTGLADALTGGVSLIEWADRLGAGGAAAAVSSADGDGSEGGGGSPSTVAPSVVDVLIDALAPPEAAALAARALAGDPHGGEGDGDGGTDLYTDARPRAVQLRAAGGGGEGRAAARVAAVAAAVRAGAGGPGLALIEED